MFQTGLVLLLSALSWPVSAPSTQCAFSGVPHHAVDRALGAWDRLDRVRINTDRQAKPVIHVFDSACQYALTPSENGAVQFGPRSFDVRAFTHGGSIDIGDGDLSPVGKIAFATTGEMGGPPVFVIALPDVWAADAADRRDPEQLFMGVFMHEFSHVQHMIGLAARFEALAAAGYSSMRLGDDVMQRTFEDDPEYKAAWQREMDVFTAAASSQDSGTAATLLREGRELMKERRRRWLSGPDRPGWAEADDIFLTLEGAGQWAGFTWMSDPQGAGLTRAAALSAMRTRWWSQEEGMMIMLALDKVLPQWPALTFGSEAMTIDELLDRALDHPSDAPEMVLSAQTLLPSKQDQLTPA